jgi:hypothetical protein
MDDTLVRRIDRLSGRRGRSRFIRDAVEAALTHRDRAKLILATHGTIHDAGHVWDENPAAWVRRQRRSNAKRVG